MTVDRRCCRCASSDGTGWKSWPGRHDLDWATLALDEGFADQSHMSRAVRQISGFAPAEFAKRFIEDESFWVYRLWV